MLSKIKTVVLGNEWDPELWGALKSVITELGGIVTEASWGVGGSQEIESFEVNLGESTIHVESETYIGLSITGEASIVEQIKNSIDERL